MKTEIKCTTGGDSILISFDSDNSYLSRVRIIADEEELTTQELTDRIIRSNEHPIPQNYQKNEDGEHVAYCLSYSFNAGSFVKPPPEIEKEIFCNWGYCANAAINLATECIAHYENNQ